jgi:uncharacterized protein Yka (UPF0111/DUF47 family)
MINQHWDVMNNLEESFSNINAISFMLEELTEAMDNNRIDQAHDIVDALNAFLPVYIDNWDRNFKKAWNEVVKVTEEYGHISDAFDNLPEEELPMT